MKAENKVVMDAIAAHFTKNPESKTAVLHISSISANSKAISEALKTVGSKNKDKTVYLFAADANEGRVVHGCHVSEDAKGKGADAAAWSTNVAGTVGGKAGGKGATSLGQGTHADKVDEGVQTAIKYLEDLKI